MHFLAFEFSAIRELTTEGNRVVFGFSDGELLALEETIRMTRMEKMRFKLGNFVEFRGTNLCLPPALFFMLQTVYTSPGHVISVEDLISEVWGGFIDLDSVKTYLRRLRKMFREAGEPLPLRTRTSGGTSTIFLDF